jgi:uncharacterized protein (DUF1330 family)
MRASALGEVKQSLDRLIGKVEALAAAIEDHGSRLRALGERVAQLEEGVKATKDVVDTFAAAKLSIRTMKWAAGVVAASVGLWAAVKDWLQK